MMNDYTSVPVKHMMATTAIHKLGDISRNTEDLCVIYGEDGDNWIGNWVTGFGFIEVRFPKESTRKLTESEISDYNSKHLFINNNYIGQIVVQ